MSRTMRYLVVVAVLCVLVGSIRCQEQEGGGGEGGEDTSGNTRWARFKKAVRRAVESIKKAWNNLIGEMQIQGKDFNSIFTELKEEISRRSKEMTNISSSMWEEFKNKMKELVTDISGPSDSEKGQMTNYIERLRMPENKEQ